MLSGKTYEISPFGRNDGAFMGFDIGGGWWRLRRHQPPPDQRKYLSSRVSIQINWAQCGDDKEPFRL